MAFEADAFLLLGFSTEALQARWKTAFGHSRKGCDPVHTSSVLPALGVKDCHSLNKDLKMDNQAFLLFSGVYVCSYTHVCVWRLTLRMYNH